MENERGELNRRDVLVGGLASTVAAGVAAPLLTSTKALATEAKDFGGQKLVVNTYGGSFGEAWRKQIIAPFEAKYNARVSLVESLTGDTVAKLMASKNNPQFDVVLLGDNGAVTIDAADMFLPMSEEAVPSLKDLLPIARRGVDPYADFIFGAEVIAYNKEKLPEPPKAIEDLYDPKYKGRIVLPDLANSTSGIVFLVHLAELNGGSVDNIEPAFEAIERMKPNVLTFWTSMQQMSTLLTSGEAWAGIWAVDRVGALMKSGAPVDFVFPAEGVKVFGNSIGIIKGTKVPELAAAYANFVLSADIQGPFCEAALLTPTNSKVKLPPEVQPFVPSPAVSTSIDWSGAVGKMPEWVNRWNSIIAQ